MNCEKVCDGIETDYYSNGKIRLKAEFKNGLVIGELKRYYQNGIIKEVSVYDNDGILIKTTLLPPTPRTVNVCAPAPLPVLEILGSYLNIVCKSTAS